jgi:hypothetical protein
MHRLWLVFQNLAGLKRALEGYSKVRRTSEMHSATHTLLLLLYLMATCHGYSKFETACSIPSNSVNFVSSPDSRGTLDILWSCLFTLVACTWTIQHLNVPEQQKGPAGDHSSWCDFKRALKGFWTNLKWMIATMLAPEYILGKALGDLVAAWLCRERMKDLAKEDKVEWGLAHGFYANMGGFVGVSEDEEVTAEPILLSAKSIYWLRNKERALGFEAGLENGAAGSQNKRKTKIQRLPDITTAELQDKSKGDIFVKTIAITQVFWVALQITVRAAKGLAISQLELAVAAFSVCAIITYLLLIPKPQGVRVPTRCIRCEPGSIEQAVQKQDGARLRMFFVPGLILDDEDVKRKRIPNDHIYFDFDINGKVNIDETPYTIYACMLGFVVGGVIFGSIHIAGWNLTFPTPIEQKLWRISSILLTTLLPVIFVPLLLVMRSHTLSLMASLTFFQVWNLLLGVLYIVACLFMLVQIFRTLLYLPPDAYISTWASNVPHVA